MKNSKNSFVILLTTDTRETLYAVCIIDDYIKEYPTFISNNQDTKISQLSNSTRCYCLVSRYPFFELLLDVLLYILDTEEKMLKLPPEDRTVDTNQVSRTLEYLFPLKAPQSGRDIDLGLPNFKRYPRPLHEPDEILIGEFCLPTIFQTLDRDKILSVISSVMLERKVVFISSNLRKLTNCVMSFVALVRPFVLQCVFIPVVPDTLVEITHAPVPFIAGLTENRLLKIARSENQDIVVVDLDKNRLNYPPTVRPIPLPNARQLSRQIDTIYSKLRRTFQSGVIPFIPTKEQKEYSRLILCETESYMSKLLGRLRNHCITSLTDNVTIFLKESFLKDEITTDEIFSFYSEFFDTQIFSMYSDKILNDIDTRREQEYHHMKTPLKISLRASRKATSPTKQNGMTDSTKPITNAEESGLDVSGTNSISNSNLDSSSNDEVKVMEGKTLTDSSQEIQVTEMIEGEKSPVRSLKASYKSKSSRGLLDMPKSYTEPSILMGYERKE